MPKSSFLQLDVFATQPGRGNPLAVVLDAEGLDTAGMQAIAAWLNPSETTFVLPPTQAGADYRLRIFTSRQELPFAGHPSVGTAHAVLDRCLAMPHEGCLAQECAAGLLPVRVEGEGAQRRLHVRAPRGAERAADPTAVLASHRGVRVGALRPDLERMTKATEASSATGVAVFARCLGSSYALVVRAFVPADANRRRGGPSTETVEWPAPEQRSRAVREYLAALDEAEPVGATPKYLSMTDPAARWTAAPRRPRPRR